MHVEIWKTIVCVFRDFAGGEAPQVHCEREHGYIR